MSDEISISAEEPAAPIPVTRLTVPLILMLLAGSGLMAAGALIATTHGQLADHEARISHIEAKQEPVPIQLQGLSDRVSELERTVSHIDEGMGRIQDRLGVRR